MAAETRLAVSNTRRNRLARSQQTFIRVFLVAAVLCGLFAIFSPPSISSQEQKFWQKRSSIIIQDEDCHAVHSVHDKCAFVRANCDDEEPGYISYLQFYYCSSLASAKTVAFLIIICWLAMLFSTIGLAASDFFCANLSSIATMAGMSENFAGVTLLALGNGSPDVFSTFAAMNNNSGSLAIGELVGAAGFITAVVAGTMAFIRPFKVPRKSFMRDVLFFIVASGFTLGFLADGRLYLWECVTMVLLYVVYVCLVVWWHWYFGKVKRRKAAEALARSHYNFQGTGAADLDDRYQDEDEDRDARDVVTSRQTTFGEDFAALERGNGGSGDNEEEELERLKGQLTSQMRLRRPTQRSRRITPIPDNPIRPSLLGALEFQTVLSGLQQAGNLQSYPLHARRYSDDPSMALAQSIVPNFSDPDLAAQNERPSGLRTASGNRARAISSVEGATTLPIMSAPRIDLLAPVEDASPALGAHPAINPAQTRLVLPPSPAISISPPASEGQAEDQGNDARPKDSSFDLLAPPGTRPQPLVLTQGARHSRQRSLLANLQIIQSNDSSATDGDQFPTYSDDDFTASPINTTSQSPFMLPSPAQPHSTTIDVEENSRPVSWWPYWILPAPNNLFSTLFPTLCSWKAKSFAARIVAVLSVPSVFLLTITLPVVEIEKDSADDFETNTVRDFSLPHTTSSTPEVTRQQHNGNVAEHEPDGPQVVSHALQNAHGTSAVVHQRSPASFSSEAMPVVPQHSTSEENVEQDTWNRWLVMLQMFTAPFFCVVITWSNVDYGNGQLLLKASIGSLIVSTILAVLVHFTTEADRPPRWQGILCVLGFCVSIAWISTIASEVVGVLKAIGVIFNISDAVLGLTIFAVGNSLGDLVADVTIARLGYSVMALSACFGGPMLNILLGIGLSGAYMTIHGAEKRHHRNPNKKYKVKPYLIEVDRTLMISGVALLVTLVGLLIAVPLRRWRMDRVVGWGLIGLWVLSTMGNLITELILGPDKLTKHS